MIMFLAQTLPSFTNTTNNTGGTTMAAMLLGAMFATIGLVKVLSFIPAVDKFFSRSKGSRDDGAPAMCPITGTPTIEIHAILKEVPKDFELRMQTAEAQIKSMAKLESERYEKIMTTLGEMKETLAVLVSRETSSPGHGRH